MPVPGNQTFAPSDLDKLSDEEIKKLLQGTGYRVPPPRVPPKPDVYKANFKGDN